MRRAIFQIRRLLPASVLLLALSSCGTPRPTVTLTPPADLLTHPDEPPMTDEALTSEKAYEDQRNAKIEWGRQNAAIVDRACWWMQDAGVKLTCAKRP